MDYNPEESLSNDQTPMEQLDTNGNGFNDDDNDSNQEGKRSRSRSPQEKNNSKRQRNTKTNNGLSDKDLGLKYKWDKTVYVSNIPYEVKWSELKDLFKSKVGDIFYCEIFEKDGKSLGVGSIEFKERSDAERAVEVLNQFELNGRKLTVRLDEEGYKTRKAKEMSKGINKIQTTQLDTNNNNSNTLALLNALGLGGGTTNASNILGLLSSQNLNSNVSGLNLATSQSNTVTGISKNSALLDQLAKQLNIEGPVTSRVFVASLDFKVDEYKLREVFNLAGRVLGVTLFRDRDNKSRGIALVEYENGLEALNAVSMFDKQVLNSRAMNVRFDTKPPKEGESQSKLPSGLKSVGSGLGLGLNLMQKPLDSAAGMTSSMDQLAALSAGLSNPLANLNALAGLASLTAANSSLGLSGLLSGLGANNLSSNTNTSRISKIFVKNLPFAWDERKLKEKFRQAGLIEYAEIKQKDGKSRGFGLVKFYSPEQAQKCVELFNGSRFDGRTLDVKLDQMS